MKTLIKSLIASAALSAVFSYVSFAEDPSHTFEVKNDSWSMISFKFNAFGFIGMALAIEFVIRLITRRWPKAAGR